MRVPPGVNAQVALRGAGVGMKGRCLAPLSRAPGVPRHACRADGQQGEGSRFGNSGGRLDFKIRSEEAGIKHMAATTDLIIGRIKPLSEYRRNFAEIID